MALVAKALSSAMMVACLLTLSTHAQAQSSGMTFFVTSVGVGNGANLGGLAGADTHCQRLAQAAGAGGNTWHAYLSTQAAGGQPAVNARDRIGRGPWQNAKGVVVAKDLDELHGANQLTKQTALTEKVSKRLISSEGLHLCRTGSGLRRIRLFAPAECPGPAVAPRG